MPALMPTEVVATITWLGAVPDRASGLRSVPRDVMELDFDGFAGEAHAGRTRPSDSRVTAQHPLGTEIANTRQLSIVAAEDLAEIATQIGLETLDPSFLGASVVVQGIVDFSNLPPSSRLQGPDGCTLIVDMQNRPCTYPSDEIERDHPGHGRGFKAAARGRRGVTAWVERPGTLRLGDRLRLHVPHQPAWQGWSGIRRG